MDVEVKDVLFRRNKLKNVLPVGLRLDGLVVSDRRFKLDDRVGGRSQQGKMDLLVLACCVLLHRNGKLHILDVFFSEGDEPFSADAIARLLVVVGDEQQGVEGPDEVKVDLFLLGESVLEVHFVFPFVERVAEGRAVLESYVLVRLLHDGQHELTVLQQRHSNQEQAIVSGCVNNGMMDVPDPLGAGLPRQLTLLGRGRIDDGIGSVDVDPERLSLLHFLLQIDGLQHLPLLLKLTPNSMELCLLL
jgi:hypothetical protein